MSTLAAHPLLADPHVTALLRVLSAEGEEARIVGGAVRDALMGIKGGDVDIATTVLPPDVMTRVQAAGWKAVPTGLEHGTITVVIAGKPYEVTTLRRDVATDGRRAVVAFTRNFGEDAFRRDFTINALSASADGTVHDYATGIADAAKGMVRFMGDPSRRIEEDYLRILRFFRFHASHGRGNPDAAGLAACAAHKAGVERLSRERLRQELLKLLVASGASSAITLMDIIGLWSVVFDGAEPDVAATVRLIALEKALQQATDPVLRLATLCAPVDPEQWNLKLSRHEQTRMVATNRHACAFGADVPDETVLRRLVFVAGMHFVPALLLGHARAGIDWTKTQGWLRASEPLVANTPTNPFKSSQAAALGVEAGPRMGEVLRKALELWLASGLPEDRIMQASLLKQAVAAQQG